jgi:hypothetical protein
MFTRAVLAVFLISVTHDVPAREPAPAELAATHGFVRVSLPQWQSANVFVLRNAQTKKDSVLTRQSEDGPYSYGAWLREGEYEIPDTHAQDGGRYEPIVVRAGEITDLGAVLKIQLGGYESVWLPLQHAEAAVEIAAAQARLGALVKNLTSWRPSAPPQPIKEGTPDTHLGLIADLIMMYDRKVNKPPLSKQLREARTLETLMPLARLAVAPRIEEAGVDEALNFYYGADFGQVRVRHADGVWGSIDTGTLDEITAVSAKGTRLVAGTLRGALLAGADSGQSWSPLRRLDRDEIVVDIDHVGARWFVLAAQSAGQRNPWMLAGRLRVYSSARDDFADLAPIKDFVIPKNMFGRIDGFPQSLVGRVVGASYFVNTITELQRLDTHTLEWTAAKPPHRVDSFEVSRDGTLITAVRLQGAFSKITVSNDGGSTWLPYSRPPYTLYDVVLETADSGVATRWNSHAFSASLELYSYDPKIKDWRKTGEAPAGCVQLLHDADSRQRFCLTSGGSILDQKNGAWAVEFANE